MYEQRGLLRASVSWHPRDTNTVLQTFRTVAGRRRRRLSSVAPCLNDEGSSSRWNWRRFCFGGVGSSRSPKRIASQPLASAEGRRRKGSQKYPKHARSVSRESSSRPITRRRTLTCRTAFVEREEDLLRSVPGSRPVTARTLLSDLPELARQAHAETHPGAGWPRAVEPRRRRPVRQAPHQR